MDEEILLRIRKIEERLDILEKAMKNAKASTTVNPPQSINVNELLALPSSLQKTMLAIQELKEATANEIADKTDRDRSVETIYLNQLTRLGHLHKERRGHKIYFKVIRYY